MAYKIILEEVKRLWTLADTFIATKMSDTSTRVRTVEEQDRLLQSLVKRDRALILAAMEAHRTSTASGLSPETLLLETLNSADHVSSPHAATR